MADVLEHLEITTLTHGGRGLGRHDGKAIFVPLTAPGDIVSCKILRDKKSFIEAELLEISTPASARRAAPCPYFGQCGGCQWQHLPYDEQARWKERLFSEQLLRNGLISENRLKPVVRAAEEWFYRNRAQFKCSISPHSRRIGFFRHASHTVVDVTNCMLLAPRLQQAYALLRSELFAACPCPESVYQVDMAIGDSEEVRVLVYLQSEFCEEMSDWLRRFAEENGFNACLQQGRAGSLQVVAGNPSLSVLIDALEITLEYGPQGFAQINSSQNRAMIREMLSLLAAGSVRSALDLFCGMGNFSLPLASIADRVVGVENNARSIEYAKKNAADNLINNVEFYTADAVAFLKELKVNDFDLVVLDPPRAGHSQAVREIANLMPDRILYISCDPATLARDLRVLVEAGYEVVFSRPFDLFPQTWHIESMTLLQGLGARG